LGWSPNVLSKTLATLTKNLGYQDYGLVHVAIQIGCRIIHWLDDSLVHFTPIRSNTALLALDITQINNLDEDHSKLVEICKISAMYNNTKQYNNKNCNCHHLYVNDISVNQLEN